MKKLVISLCLMGLLCGVASADTIYLTRDGSQNGFSIVSDELGRSIAPRVVVRCTLSSFEANDVSAARGEFTQIDIPGFQRSPEVGSPAVPVMSQLMEVPFGAELTVRVISQNEMEHTLADLGISHPLAPCQPSHRKDSEPVYEYNPESYAVDAYTELPLVQVEEAGTLRSYRIARIQVAPVQYNPVRGTMRVITELEFEICMEGADLSRTAETKNLYDSPYFAWVGERLLTPDSLRSLSRGYAGPVTYAIVADRMFANDLQPFVDAKTQKGMRVVVAYTDQIGTTTSSIQSYLHGLYKNATPEKTAPSFILFAGDKEQIPAFSGTKGSYITDLYYGAVTPGDCLPEMLSGRFSAQNSSQILPQVSKTIEYEKHAFPDKSFLKNTVMVAGWDSSHAVEWGYPQINYGIENYFHEGKGFNPSHKFLTSSSQQNASKIRALIGAGACFVNYTAHGGQTDWSDPSLTISDINSMPNKGRYPLVVGNCCLTNSFQVGTCFGEAWLRADGRGAIGYIGGSSYTYWDEDLWWGVGFYSIAHPNPSGAAPKREDTKKGAYDTAFEGKLLSNAGFMMAGNLAVEQSTSPRKVYYWEVYHIMGDPGLMTYWGEPSSNPVQHPAGLARTADSVEIQAEAGSYVGISMDGQVVGAGVADENGRVSVQLQPFPATGEATISVIRLNRIPYTATLQIR